MTKWDWTKMAIEIGVRAVDAILDGRYQATVYELLPDSYKDRDRLRELEEAARRDYRR